MRQSKRWWKLTKFIRPILLLQEGVLEYRKEPICQFQFANCKSLPHGRFHHLSMWMPQVLWIPWRRRPFLRNFRSCRPPQSRSRIILKGNGKYFPTVMRFHHLWTTRVSRAVSSFSSNPCRQNAREPILNYQCREGNAVGRFPRSHLPNFDNFNLTLLEGFYLH